MSVLPLPISTSIITRRLCYVRYFTTEALKKSVFISQSTDIYTNLALEDWLYRKYDFTNHHVLMLWQSTPCVVIGRHQNPWLEANVAQLGGAVTLARRNSGGGTVYHDKGNLNLTFFTSRDHYNRRRNLELIVRVLRRNYDLPVIISSRDDLTVDALKVSGTAAKLGRPNSYHHCTLLVDADKQRLRQSLRRPYNVTFDTNATQSTHANIINLNEVNPLINVPSLLDAVGWEFLKDNQTKSFPQMINPQASDRFPGLSEIHTHLASWDWCYGKTPKFSISRQFSIPQHLTSPDSNVFRVILTVENGRISDVATTCVEFAANNVGTELKGQKFTHETLNNCLESIGGDLLNERDRFVSDCIKSVMTAAV